MSKLTAAKRDALPKADFALPGKKAFPIENKGHAVAAKARATQAVNAGKMSKATESKIDSKANKKLGAGMTKAPKGHEHLSGSKHFGAK